MDFVEVIAGFDSFKVDRRDKIDGWMIDQAIERTNSFLLGRSGNAQLVHEPPQNTRGYEVVDLVDQPVPDFGRSQDLGPIKGHATIFLATDAQKPARDRPLDGDISGNRSDTSGVEEGLLAHGFGEHVVPRDLCGRFGVPVVHQLVCLIAELFNSFVAGSKDSESDLRAVFRVTDGLPDILVHVEYPVKVRKVFLEELPDQEQVIVVGIAGVIVSHIASETGRAALLLLLQPRRNHKRCRMAQADSKDY